MKLTIEQKTLSQALAKVASIVERRNTIPILGNVALYAFDGALTITATDLDVSLSITLDADVEEQGSTTVPSDLFSAIVKRAKNTVKLTLNDGKLTVASGKAKAALGTIPVDDFPAFKEPGYTNNFEVSKSDIDNLFGKVSYAISTDESRPSLNGVYLTAEEGKLTSVATDGHRLAKSQVDITVDFNGVIVPRKTVSVISRIFDIGTVSVSVCENGIKMNAGDTVLCSRLIGSRYPDYNRVIPPKSGTMIKLDGAELRAAIDYVATVCAERVRAVKVTVAKDHLKLSVASSEHSANDEIDAHVTGEPMEIGFNSKYLTETLSAIGGDDVTIYMTAGAPALFVPDGDESSKFVVMPMLVH